MNDHVEDTATKTFDLQTFQGHRVIFKGSLKQGMMYARHTSANGLRAVYFAPNMGAKNV